MWLDEFYHPFFKMGIYTFKLQFKNNMIVKKMNKYFAFNPLA